MRWPQQQEFQCGRGLWAAESFNCRYPTSHATSPVGLAVKSPPANAGGTRDLGSSPRWGRPPGEGHGTPLQYPCLENPLDREAWQATAHRVAKERDMTEVTEQSAHVSLWYQAGGFLGPLFARVKTSAFQR